MKIKKIHPYLKSLPLTKPYSISYQTISAVDLVFLDIELENGQVGTGSASPAEFVVGENSKQTFGNLQSEIIQRISGRDIRHFRQIIQEVKKEFPHFPGTLAAVDLALHDTFCKWLGIPVAAFYGQKIQALPTSVTIGIKNVQETLEEAEGYWRTGFKILKVKTGVHLEEDVERVVKLHARFGQAMKIRVDANQGYSLDDLKNFIKATRSMGLELIEQPLPVGKEKELLTLEEHDRNLLAADESIKDAKAALIYSAPPQPFHIFNIKLMKCGGILGAMEIASIAANGGIDLFWGCNDESIVSITAALHTAYCCGNTRYIDLDGSFDIIEAGIQGGFSLKDGMMHINDRPGFGVDYS
jgi:L-alanine-DL-glutamate epimerase-like enolase superfamily enzyme